MKKRTTLPATASRREAEKSEQQTAEWQRLARKQGLAYRFTFLRIIKQVTGCGDAVALQVFEKALQEKIIIQTGVSGGEPGVPIYKAQ